MAKVGEMEQREERNAAKEQGMDLGGCRFWKRGIAFGCIRKIPVKRHLKNGL